MKQNDTVTRRQFVAVAFVSVLSPMIRRFPRALAAAAGRAAWLAAPLALLPLALALFGAWLLFRNRPAGTGYAELLSAALGLPLARVLTALYALWMLFYAGFLLRSGANRFVSTVYPGAAPWIFAAGMALVCAVAAAGPLRAIARAAMLLRPLMAAIPLLVFLLTVKDADFSLLLPVTAGDLLPAGRAALETANLLGVAGHLAFAGGRLEGRFRVRDFAGWTAVLLAVIGLTTAGCIGMFGPELTAKMSYPLFMLTRDVTVLGALERVEPAAIAVWVFCDFILISALLWIAARNLRFCLRPRPAGTEAQKPMPRWSAPLCAAAALGAALLVPEGVTEFGRLSDRIVPLVNAGLVFLLPLLTLLVGKLRKAL